MNKYLFYLSLIMSVFMYGMDQINLHDLDLKESYAQDITETCIAMKQFYPDNPDLQVKFYKSNVRGIFERIAPDDLGDVYQIQEVDENSYEYYPSGRSRNLSRTKLMIRRGHQSKGNFDN